MRDPNRIERICNLIKEKWKQVPDQRLGQFLRNFIFNRESPPSMFNQEDDMTEERLRNLDINLITIKTRKKGIYVEDFKKDNYRSLKDLKE